MNADTYRGRAEPRAPGWAPPQGRGCRVAEPEAWSSRHYRPRTNRGDEARAALRLLFDSPTTAPVTGSLRPETELPQAVRVQISRPEALDW